MWLADIAKYAVPHGLQYRIYARQAWVRLQDLNDVSAVADHHRLRKGEERPGTALRPHGPWRGAAQRWESAPGKLENTRVLISRAEGTYRRHFEVDARTRSPAPTSNVQGRTNVLVMAETGKHVRVCRTRHSTRRWLEHESP
jgi:hypothetical protein